MSGASSVSRPSTGAVPVCDDIAGQAVRPDATSSPESARLSPATARSPASRITSPSSAPSPESVPVTLRRRRPAPAKPTSAPVRRRPISSPSGTAAESATCDRQALAGGAARGGQPAARARVEKREVGERGLEADVGLRARDLPVRGEGELRVVEAQVLGADAGLVAHRPAGERGLAGHQRVEARVAEREVGGAAVEGEVEAAAQRADAAVGAQVDAAAERAVGEAGEDREVGDADGVAAGEGQVLELARR